MRWILFLLSGICHHPVHHHYAEVAEELGAGFCLHGDCDSVLLGAIRKRAGLEGEEGPGFDPRNSRANSFL